MSRNDQMPLVSIIVPIYNAETTIERCLDCLAAQTYQNIEVILVNDGSADASKTICESYCQRYDYFKLIDQKNGGPATARNNGIDHSSGKYVYFVDADDYAELNTVELMVEAAEQNSAEMVICSYFLERGDAGTLKHQFACESKLYSGEEYEALCLNLIHDVSEKRIPPYSCIRMVRRSCLENPRIRYEEGLIRSEDYHFFVRLQFRLSNVYVITEPLYHYVELQTSITHSYVPRYWDSVKFIYEDLSETLPKTPSVQKCLDIMLLQRTLIAMNNSSRATDKACFHSEMREIVRDDLVVKTINRFSWKDGKKKFGYFYVLMKLKLYPIVIKRYAIKFRRNRGRSFL